VLGIRDPLPLPSGRWGPADQNWFFQGEKISRFSGRWETRSWEGDAAAHGTVHEERWRGGSLQGNARWDKGRSL
jgi:hypothetical protein